VTRSGEILALARSARKRPIASFSIVPAAVKRARDRGRRRIDRRRSEGAEDRGSSVKDDKRCERLDTPSKLSEDGAGFVRAVDAIGCVYTDVDRRYYHSNAEVASGSAEEYSAIDIKPGYQKLCGKKALEYLRYRHTDTDIVRSARQQSFLGQARHQISPAGLLNDEQGLVKTLTEYTSSDIKHSSELITLLDLLYGVRGAEVNQVHFPAVLGPSYVYANPTDIHHAVEEFLGEAGFKSKKLAGEEPKKAKASKQGGGKKNSSKGKKKHHAPPGGDELVPASEAGKEMGEKVETKTVGRREYSIYTDSGKIKLVAWPRGESTYWISGR
jgi:hypothetical protein